MNFAHDPNRFWTPWTGNDRVLNGLTKLGLCVIAALLCLMLFLAAGCRSNAYETSDKMLAGIKAAEAQAQADGVVTPDEKAALAKMWAEYAGQQSLDKSNSDSDGNLREAIAGAVTLVLGAGGVLLNNYIRNGTSANRTAEDLRSETGKVALNQHLVDIGVLPDPKAVGPATALNPHP
jgi:tellurite resistance protein